MRPERAHFYVKWAQAFVDFLHGKRLRHRSRQDIEAFLADLGKRPGIEERQARQAALRAGINKKVSCHTCATPLPRICLKRATIFAQCRNY